MPDNKSDFSVRMKSLLLLSLDRDKLMLYFLVQLFDRFYTITCIYKYNLWTTG